MMKASQGVRYPTIVGLMVGAVFLLAGVVASLLNGNAERDGNRLRVWHGAAKDITQRQYGFVDTGGRWAIRPKFDAASEFSEGIALVRSGESYRYILTDGGVAIDRLVQSSGSVVPAAEWSAAGEFHEGHAAIVLPGGMHFMDRTGHETGFVDGDYHDLVGPGLFPLGVSFSDGVAVLGQGGQFGAVDFEGRWVLEPQYATLASFKCGVAIAGRKKKGSAIMYGVISAAGEVVVPFEFDWIVRAGRDCFVVTREGSYGMIDRQGGWRIPMSKGVLSHFSEEGLGLIEDDGRAIIDAEGTRKFAFKWERMGGYAEGLCGVWSPHEAGYIDEGGKMVFTVRGGIRILDRFNHGLADVWMGEGRRGHGLINREGKLVVWDDNEEW